MKKLLFLNIFLICALCCFYISSDLSVSSYFSNLRSSVYNKTKNTALVADNQSLSLNNTNKKMLLNNPSYVKVENYGNLYNDVIKLVKNAYVENVNDDKFFESSLSGMLSSLDPHSAYFTKSEYQQLLTDTNGEFSGLGIEVIMDNSLIKVVSPIDDTPAYKAGIKAGDYISYINDKSVIGMSLNDAINMMRGKDSKDRGVVKLTILRSGEKEPLEFKIKRDVIKTESVKGRAEGNIVYLRISSFTNQTYPSLIKEFNRVENQIKKDNVKGLVLDLRNNPGGLLDSSVLVSDLFLDKGKEIVSIKGKNDVLLQKYISKNNQDLIPNLPMVVLVNEGSASASEIVAGALQDNKRAIIVGTRSFGKGSVQSIIPLNNGGAIKLTIARYYTPSGKSIQAEGIKPDIEVKMAKIEEIDTNKWMKREDSLARHLENENPNNELVTKELEQHNNPGDSMYNKDYQLARAVDLLLGINFYNHDAIK